MKALYIVLLAIAVTACGDKNSSTESKESPASETVAVVEDVKLDLGNLPATVNVTLDLDPSVEEGFDAFGNFTNDGQLVTVGVSEQVAKAGGIDTSKPYQGNVTITLAGEHDLSRELYRIYTVSSIKAR
jgi:hypothetical protein